MSFISKKEYSTHNFHGYNVKFSPFHPELFAVAASENYGIMGGGALLIFNTNLPEFSGENIVYKQFSSQPIYDMTWSEDASNLVVTASGNGEIQMWNTSLNSAEPIIKYHEHNCEASSLHWSPIRGTSMFLSTSWDGCIKIWDPNFASSLLTIAGHDSLVYEACWSPHTPSAVASVSGDGNLKLWDTKANMNTAIIQMQPLELLSVDWAKYSTTKLAIGAIDGSFYEYDVRNTQRPFLAQRAHSKAIKKIKYYPFYGDILATVSYDFKTILWNTAVPMAVQVLTGHSEFVYGLDFSVLVEGLVADCGWDKKANLYFNSLPSKSYHEDNFSSISVGSS